MAKNIQILQRIIMYNDYDESPIREEMMRLEKQVYYEELEKRLKNE